MHFDMYVKNIGKLADAQIEIGQFTVLAGPNNTGKSFVSKLLYSLLDAMHANHADVYMKHIMDADSVLLRYIDRLEFVEESEDTEANPITPILHDLQALNDFFKRYASSDVRKLGNALPELMNKIKELQTNFASNRPLLEEMAGRNEFTFFNRQMANDLFDEFESHLRALQEKVAGKSAQEIIESGLEYKIRENLILNFQIPNLANLRGKDDSASLVDIANFGKFNFVNGDINFSIGHNSLLDLQKYSRVLYLESPMYWRLKSVLEDFRGIERHSSSRRKRITGIPGYFYDLTSALRYEYTGEMDFPDIHQHLTGKDVMGGKIMLSDEGNLLFNENGRSFTLPVTALGVANLGMLALLIERKVLDKNTFLFIDEPEAHLHPAWQVIMAEALFALAEKGVHVVIATHSPDILKWLEVHAKKNPDAKELIALNKFPINSEESDSQDFDDKMAAIKRELTKPFADLYAAGL